MTDNLNFKCIFLALFLLFIPISNSIAESKDDSLPVFVLLKPQALLSGGHIGVDIATSDITSSFIDISHQYYFYKNSAVNVGIKYYLHGKVGRGMYFKAKNATGMFHEQHPVSDKRYFTGIGLGLGFMHPFGRSRWYFAVDGGMKYCYYFGKNYERKSYPLDGLRNFFGSVYNSFFSTASYVDVGFYIGYRF